MSGDETGVGQDQSVASASRIEQTGIQTAMQCAAAAAVRVLSVLLIALVLGRVDALAAPASANSHTRFADVRRIVDRGKLVVAVIDREVPPLIVTDGSGDLSGFDSDLAREIAHILDVDIAFDRRAGTYRRVVDLVATGLADIAVSFLRATGERSRSVLFSRPYIQQRHSVLVNRFRWTQVSHKCPDRHGLRDLAKQHNLLGLEKGSTYENWYADNVGGGYPKIFKSSHDMWQSVHTGDLTGSVQGELPVAEFLQKNPAYRVTTELCLLHDAPIDNIAIAVRPDAPNLLRIINTVLETKGIFYTIDDIVGHEGPWPWQSIPEQRREVRTPKG